ncbi:FAD:protein FMN transferase [Thermoflexales bacterium]|nr:FAD:protein FMN transferase [Thermoflexales bacterium]
MHRLDFRAMGCHMTAVLDADQGTASVDTVPIWFEAWEQALSRFRGDSELNQLNQRAGQWVCVSPTLWDVIQHALLAARWTEGLFSPTILNALEAAGYDRTFDQIRTTGGPAVAQPDGQWRSIQRQSLKRSICLPPNVRLDLGGVAKGWAANRAAKKLGVHGPALIDAGGDIAVSGPRTDGSPWPIGVLNPFQPDQSFETLKIEQGGVATSGKDHRRWLRAGQWQHHLIDPRTGLSAQSDVLSATVIAPTTFEAEIAAKVIVISGSQHGLAWLEEQPDYATVIVREDGRAVYSTKMNHYLWS